MEQSHSVFAPGLTARGPVYNAMDGLPTVSPMVKFGLIGALLYLGMNKKIPMIAAGAGAFAIWQMLPSTATAAPIPGLTADQQASVDQANADAASVGLQF